jgi:hypothetical protein
VLLGGVAMGSSTKHPVPILTFPLKGMGDCFDWLIFLVTAVPGSRLSRH